MTAGFNVLVDITTYTYPSDDAWGGSQPSGTVLASNVQARFEPIEPTMALLEQGLETEIHYRITLSYVGRYVSQNDTLTIRGPYNHIFVNKNFRVISISRPSLRTDDPRSYVVCICRRVEESHGNFAA